MKFKHNKLKGTRAFTVVWNWFGAVPHGRVFEDMQVVGFAGACQRNNKHARNHVKADDTTRKKQKTPENAGYSATKKYELKC